MRRIIRGGDPRHRLCPAACLLAVGLTFLSPTARRCAAQGHATPGGPAGDAAAGVRIENELKLSVPEDQTEAVWDYLTERYGPSSSFLEELGPGFSAEFSTEFFEDRYFDSADLQMLNRQGGIRHRTRRIPDNPFHPKHGRQLVQIKLRRPEDQSNVARSEIKFPTRTLEVTGNPLDSHPLLGVIERNERRDFIDAVKDLGLEPVALQEIVTIHQRRRRVYISRDGESLATITLDEVSAQKWWKEAHFVEIEMELNEVGYTEATAEKRAFMEQVNERMKQDLLAEFPAIEQNQAPKYNKMFNRLDAQFLFFPIALRTGAPCEATLAGIGLIFLGVVVSALVSYLRQRRARVRIAARRPTKTLEEEAAVSP